jgi:hypothetical protein
MYQKNGEKLVESYMIDNEAAGMLSFFGEDGSEIVIPSQ